MSQSCFFFSFFKHTKPNVTLQKLVLCVVFHLIYGVCVCVREREWWREREFSPITATLHLTEQKLMKLLRRVHAWEFVCNFFFLLLKVFFFFFHCFEKWGSALQWLRWLLCFPREIQTAQTEGSRFSDHTDMTWRWRGAQRQRSAVIAPLYIVMLWEFSQCGIPFVVLTCEHIIALYLTQLWRNC